MTKARPTTEHGDCVLAPIFAAASIQSILEAR